MQVLLYAALLLAHDERALAAPRLLHLAGGGVLRAEARFSEDRWLFERDGEWTELPAEAVVRVEREEDVLAEARKRERLAERQSASARVEAARWMADEGLLTEAFRELDELLDLDPDESDALVLLADLAPLVAVPADPAWAASAPRTLQELVALRLEADSVGPCVADLRHAEDGRRAFAALALRRLVPDGSFDDEQCGELLRRAALDRSPEVRRQASYTLRTLRDPGVIAPLVDCLASESPALRDTAAESLGHLGYPQAVEPLVQRLLTLQPADGGSRGGGFSPRGSIFVGTQRAFVQGFSAEVAQGARIAKPEIGTVTEGATLDVRVGGVSGPSYAAQVKTLERSLERLTGADPGGSVLSWKKWWEANGEAWRLRLNAPATGSVAPGG